MKVLQVLCGRTWGGGSVVVLAITRALIARGDQVHVFSFQEESDRRFREAGASLVRPPCWVEAISPLDVIVGLHLWWVCRREKFDLVATHTSKGGFLGRIAARLAGVPHIVHHAHGFAFNKKLSPRAHRFYVSLERLAARFGNLIISVNELQRTMALDLKVDRPDRICTVHNGIDLGPFAAANGEDVRRDLGLEEGTPLIGAVGRLCPQKGFVYLIRALPDVLRRVPEAHLLLVGEGPLRAELEREAIQCGVATRVHFLGFRRDIPGVLAAVDCYVQPSLWEGLSIALIEALAAARPIVATDIDGNREVLEREETGLLVLPADVAGLADAVCKLLLDRELAARLAANAGRSARERFSQARMVQQNIALYDRVAAAGNATQSPFKPALDLK